MIAPAMPHAHRLPALDGLRGLAALLVVFSHAHVFGLPQLVPFALGTWGVLLFFVLSGFLMGHLYLLAPCTARSVASYGAARIARIVPLYYGVIIGSWLLCRFIVPDFFYQIDDYQLVRHLAFAGSSFVFWSIGPEFQFYFVFPLLWWAAARARAGRPLALAATLAGAALLFLFQPLFPGILFASKLHIFLAGIALALIRRPVAEALSGTWLLLMLQFLALALLVALVLPADAFGELIYAARHDRLLNAYYGDLRRLLLVMLVIFPLSFETPPVSALLSNPLARAIGNASFSLYLLHEPVFWLLGRLRVYDAVPGTPGFLIGLGVAIAVSMASYAWLEVPSRDLLRPWLAARLTALLDRGPAAQPVSR